MNKYKENTLAVAIFIGLLSHYFFGYFFWDKIPQANIYYISVYFSMDVWSFTVFLLATGKLLKGMGALGMMLGTFFFYQEFNDPSYWEQRDYMTFGLVFANCFFIWVFTDRLKTKKL